MEKVEKAFDQCLPVLTEAKIESWSVAEVEAFLEFLKEYHRANATTEDGQTVEEDPYKSSVAEVDRFLIQVKSFLNQKVPYGSIEEPTRPKQEKESTASSAGPVVKSVDAFLYEEEDIPELIESGALSDKYCLECGSTKLGLTEFITHSFARDQLVYIVCFLLPYLSQTLSLKMSSLVEVGARFGNLLWTCYAAAEQGLLKDTGLTKVTGVELDEKMIQLQQALFSRFCCRPRNPEHPLVCSIIHANCFEGEGKQCLMESDVLVLHNVFQYFVDSPAEHLKCWLRIRETVNRPGQLLICSPSLEETLSTIPSSLLLAELGDSTHTGRKRPRKEEGGDGEDLAHRWVEEYVERISVEEVQEKFLALRTAGIQGHCCSDGCGHSHPCSDEDDEVKSVVEEMEERVKNVFVYRIK